MAFTEFYCQTTGSNLNAGSTTADAAGFTYASGSWVASTGVFTVASGDPATDGVAVGNFASVYADGATVGVFVGRVTARDATTITVSLTAKSGTAPTDGTNTRTLKIGGAWKGPNAAENFPFNFAANAMTNSSADPVRVNLKGGTNYAITAAITHANAAVTFQGYTTSAGDGGRATTDGGTAGASYVLLTLSGEACVLEDVVLQNNGATGSAAGLVISGTDVVVRRCVANSVRGNGVSITGNYGVVEECEAYACNQSNTGNSGGFSSQATSLNFVNCIAHDNAGSNSSGFLFTTTGLNSCIGCIAESNGQHGFYTPTARDSVKLIGCDAYNNTGDGFRVAINIQPVFALARNCNFIKNGGYGMQLSGSPSTSYMRAINCGFGAGTEANTSGKYPSGSFHASADEVTYASNVNPWVDPANGDFRINLAAAKGAGRGAFTQTAASYAGTIAYPDIGSAQHQDAGGGGGGPVISGPPLIL